MGVIDESSPEIGADQVVYTMALVIFDDADQDLVRQMLTATLNRRRALHWEREGTVVKQRIVDLLCTLPVTAHAYASIVHRSPNKQHVCSCCENTCSSAPVLQAPDSC